MRRAYHGSSLLIENGIFYGVSLGYDFCAEHEWGIKNINTKFGIDKTKMGIEGREITINNSIFFKENDELCVLTSRKFDDKKELKDILPNDIRTMYKDFETAWDSDNFCIVSKTKEHFTYLRQLYDAFQNKNILITYIDSNIPVFNNSSLCILIIDNLPKEIINDMYNVDKKRKDLTEYEDKIGVTKLKKNSKKYFLACSPYWINYENKDEREKRKKEMGTKYDIIFWINYSDDDNNYGWYIAEDIIKWLSTPKLKLKSLNK